MLDTYDDTAAMAESASEQGAPTADHAAEQQAPDMVRSAFENLESVVTHNLGHPDERMNLAASDARVLLEDFVAGSPASIPPTAEDGRIKTFTEMSDDEIMARLPDYLASGVNSSGINIGTIEEAQAVMAEAFMSEEELEESPDPKSPKGRAARERKLLDAAREAHEDMNERMAAHQKKWDQDFHDYGGERLSGKEIMERIDWFSKKENQEKVRQELIKDGKSDKEADEIIAKKKERDELLKRQRDGKPPLTPQEQVRLDALNKDKDVILADKKQKEKMEAEKSQNFERENVRQNIAEATSEYSRLARSQREGKILTDEDEKRLNELKSNSSVSTTNSFIENAYKDSRDPLREVKANGGSASEAYNTFTTAPHVREEFDKVALLTSVGSEPTSAPAVEKSKPTPTITTAKVEAAAAAFM
ncbi:MAG: hypothetical protein WC043_06560 [Pseudobdellovibrionaceae bacterium]